MLDVWSALEILILALGIYVIIGFLRGTRGGGIIRGLGLILVLAYIAANSLFGRMPALKFVFDNALPGLAIGLLIVFQPEIRQGLMYLGEKPFVRPFLRADVGIIPEIARAAATLARQRRGALIAIERETSLIPFMARGTSLDSEVRAELLEAIFWSGNILHDGAVVIRDGRIAAAGCVLPLSTNPDVSKRLGTRHLAALGLSEETDAVTVVVSEETGTISACSQGKLERDLDPAALEAFLRHGLGLKGRETAQREAVR